MKRLWLNSFSFKIPFPSFGWLGSAIRNCCCKPLTKQSKNSHMPQDCPFCSSWLFHGELLEHHCCTNSPGRFNKQRTAKKCETGSLAWQQWAAIQQLKSLGWFVRVCHLSAMPAKISPFHQIPQRLYRRLPTPDAWGLGCCSRADICAAERLAGCKQINCLIWCDKICVPQQLSDVVSSLFRRWKG